MAPVLEQSYPVSGCGRRSKFRVLGWQMSRQGIRSLVIVILLMIPVWIAAVKFMASLWEVFNV